jgi:hypothetical protein
VEVSHGKIRVRRARPAPFTVLSAILYAKVQILFVNKVSGVKNLQKRGDLFGR